MVFSEGSVANDIQNLIDNIPTSISGAQLIAIVDRVRIHMENFTGDGIGSVGINDIYRPAMTDLSAAQLAGFMNAQGVDANSVSLGDLKIAKGGASNLATIATFFEAKGQKELLELGRATRLFKANG